MHRGEELLKSDTTDVAVDDANFAIGGTIFEDAKLWDSEGARTSALEELEREKEAERKSKTALLDAPAIVQGGRTRKVRFRGWMAA